MTLVLDGDVVALSTTGRFHTFDLPASTGRNRPWTTAQQVDQNSQHDIVTSCAYDDGGDKVTVTNGNGVSTSYGFDERHHNTGITYAAYPQDSTRSFHYDGNGNCDTRTDGRGFVTTYQFDQQNRLTVTNYQHDGRTVTNHYRVDGLRDSMNDTLFQSGYNTWTWSYNGAKLVTSDLQPVGSATVSYSYFTGSGRRQQMTIFGQRWGYTYYTSGLPHTVTQYLGDIDPVTYDYDQDDNVSHKTLATNNGWRMFYTYDSRMRMKEVDHQLHSTGAWTTKYKYIYGRDNAGNINAYNRVAGGTSYGVAYGYDYANRLLSDVSANWPGWTGWQHSDSYLYDGNGNRTSVTRNGSQSNVSCYNDPAGHNTDQFQSGDGWSVSSYDGDGNPTNLANTNTGNSLTVITYNQEDEPEATYPSWGGTSTYQFNGDHRIQSKGSASTGITTYYIYDGDTVIAELIGGNVTTHLSGVCEVQLGTPWPYTNVYQMDDGTGNMVGETGDHGMDYLKAFDYDAYGIETDMSGQESGTSNFRFKGNAGYMHDSDTEPLMTGSGLVLCGERFYVPGMGRFLTQDPIGHGGGLNLYGYCDNNPLSRTDPSGLDPDNRPQALIVLGDRSDWSGRMLLAGEHAKLAMETAFHALGYKTKVLADPTADEFWRALDASRALYYFGHASNSANLVLRASGSNGPDAIDVAGLGVKAYQWWKAGHPMLDFAYLDGCESIDSAADMWSGVAGIVFGHRGLLNTNKFLAGFDNADSYAVPKPYQPSVRKRSRPGQ